MRVGVLADSHDRLPAISSLVDKLVASGVSLVMHAGDYCAAFSLAPFRQANIAVLGVFGRNDGDREGLKAFADQSMGTELYESPHSFEVGGHRIMLVHELGEINRRSIEAHEFVLFGATHRQETRTMGETLLLNPGEACGWLHGQCTGAVLDLETREVEIIRVSGG